LMVDKMAARQGFFSTYFGFALSLSFRRCSNSFVNLSPMVIDLAIVSVFHSKYVLILHVALR
jgi:hypothetical protein